VREKIAPQEYILPELGICRTKPTHHCHAVVLQRWVSSAEARAEKGVEVDRAQLL